MDKPTPNSFYFFQQNDLMQVIQRQAREIALISSAWYDFQSRLQNGNVTVSRYRGSNNAGADSNRTWLSKQRALVGALSGRGGGRWAKYTFHQPFFRLYLFHFIRFLRYIDTMRKQCIRSKMGGVRMYLFFFDFITVPPFCFPISVSWLCPLWSDGEGITLG